MRTRFAVCLWLACIAAPAIAAGPAAGLYTDPDVAAVAFHAAPGKKAELRNALNQRLRKEPRHPVLLSHRAYLFLRAGDEVNARRDFERALESAEPGSASHRQVLWAYGWALYDMGDVPAALASWTRSEQLHGGHPGWVPYTYALAYWTQGDAETALAWYDTAVRSDAGWGSREGMTERTDHWRPEQQRHIRGLFDAWSTRAAPAVASPGR